MTTQTVTEYRWLCAPQLPDCTPKHPHDGCYWMFGAFPVPAAGRDGTGAPVPPCRAPGVTSSDLVTFVNAVTRLVNEGELRAALVRPDALATPGATP